MKTWEDVSCFFSFRIHGVSDHRNIYLDVLILISYSTKKKGKKEETFYKVQSMDLLVRACVKDALPSFFSADAITVMLYRTPGTKFSMV